MASTSSSRNAPATSPENVSGSIVCYMYSLQENPFFDKVVFLTKDDVQMDLLNVNRGMVCSGEEQFPIAVLFDNSDRSIFRTIFAELTPEQLMISLNAVKLGSPERKLLVKMGRLRSAEILQENVVTRNPTATLVPLPQVVRSPNRRNERYGKVVRNVDLIIPKTIAKQPQHDPESKVTSSDEDEEDDLDWHTVGCRSRGKFRAKSFEPYGIARNRLDSFCKEELRSGCMDFFEVGPRKAKTDADRVGEAVAMLENSSREQFHFDNDQPIQSEVLPVQNQSVTKFLVGEKAERYQYDDDSECHEHDDGYEDFYDHNSRASYAQTKFGRKYRHQLNTLDDWYSYLEDRAKEKHKGYKTRASLAVEISDQLGDFLNQRSLAKLTKIRYEAKTKKMRQMERKEKQKKELRDSRLQRRITEFLNRQYARHLRKIRPREKWTDFIIRAKHLEEVPIRKEFNAQLLQVQENIHMEWQLEYHTLMSTKHSRMIRMKEQHDAFALKLQELHMAAWVEKAEQLRAERLAARRDERMVIRRNLYELEMRQKKAWAEYEEENQRMEAEWARKVAHEELRQAVQRRQAEHQKKRGLEIERRVQEQNRDKNQRAKERKKKNKKDRLARENAVKLENRSTEPSTSVRRDVGHLPPRHSAYASEPLGRSGRLIGPETTTAIVTTGHARNRTRDGTTTGVARERCPESRK